MITEIVSMALSFLLAWHRRDKIWTPTFEGSYPQRYAAALAYYQGTMGLTGDYIVEVRPQRRVVDDEAVCAWAERAAGWHADIIGIADTRDCQRAYKPELLALHEQCHRRMAHLDLPDLLNKHAEVKDCMGWYSAKERR